MTNYEYLVQNNKLCEFLKDIINADELLIDAKYVGLSQVRSVSTNKPLLYAKWLEEEYKEAELYVKMSDVIQEIHASTDFDDRLYRDDLIESLRRIDTLKVHIENPIIGVEINDT